MSLAEFAGQAVLHALVAALFVEALLRLWRVQAPGLRLSFRLLAMTFPVLVLPAFSLLAPARREEWFRDEWALFAGDRWGGLGVGGVGLDVLALGLLSALGVALYLMDLLPFLAERIKGQAPHSAIAPEGDDPVVAEVRDLAAAMGVPAPRVLFFPGTSAPLLLCAGVCRPAVIVSRGALESLDREERRAAFAHELGHLARRDPLLSWLLMGLRTVMFWNPVVQVVGRAAVQDTECRADDRAVATTRNPMALAGGLIKLFRAGAEEPGEASWRGVYLLAMRSWRARAAAVEHRCRRLLDHESTPVVPFGGLRLVLTGLALSLLLFFVV